MGYLKENSRLTALHDKLDELYQLTEQSRNNLIAFHDHTKQIADEANHDWNEYAATTITDNVVDKVIYEQKEKLLTSFYEAVNALTARVHSCITTHAAMYKRVRTLIEDAIQQYHQLSALPLTNAQTNKLLDQLDSDIAKAAQEVHQAINTMAAFEEELNTITEDYRQQEAHMTHDMPFDAYFSMTKDQMPEDMKAEYEQKFDILHFFIDVFKPWHSEAKEALSQLTQQLYPQFSGYSGTTIERYINNANAKSANDLILQLFTMVQDQGEGVVMTDKYGKEKIEEWRAFYCYPDQPQLLTAEDRNNYPGLNDEEWEAQMKQENDEIWCYHNWEENRKKKWYDAIQPLNFNYLPDLYDLEGDYWVMYAMDLRDAYETWKLRMEHVENVLDYGMDPELLFASYEEFQNVLLEKYNLHSQEVQAKRDRMILGERT